MRGVMEILLGSSLLRRGHIQRDELVVIGSRLRPEEEPVVQPARSHESEVFPLIRVLIQLLLPDLIHLPEQLQLLRAARDRDADLIVVLDLVTGLLVRDSLVLLLLFLLLLPLLLSLLRVGSGITVPEDLLLLLLFIIVFFVFDLVLFLVVPNSAQSILHSR